MIPLRFSVSVSLHNSFSFQSNISFSRSLNIYHRAHKDCVRGVIAHSGSNQHPFSIQACWETPWLGENWGPAEPSTVGVHLETHWVCERVPRLDCLRARRPFKRPPSPEMTGCNPAKQIDSGKRVRGREDRARHICRWSVANPSHWDPVRDHWLYRGIYNIRTGM